MVQEGVVDVKKGDVYAFGVVLWVLFHCGYHSTDTELWTYVPRAISDFVGV